MTLEQWRAHAEREAIANALRRNRKNVTQAARELGVSRMTLYRLMERLNVARPETSVEPQVIETKTYRGADGRNSR